MTLLSRNLRLAAISFLFFLLSTLPLPGSTSDRLDLAPATAWAGGSPDETLNPQTPPQGRAGRYVGIQEYEGTTATSASLHSMRPASRAALSWRERIGIAFRIYLTSMLRF